MTVNLDSVNDGDIDGPQTPTLTATASGFDNGQTSLSVTDDDSVGSLTIGGKLTGHVAAGSYSVTASLVVPSQTSLILDPGASIAFSSGQSLTVNGTLTAQGTTFQPILLRSAAASPAPGDWTGIRFSTSSLETASSLSYIEIRHAQSGIFASGGDPAITIDHADIHHNSVYGVEFQNALSSAVVLSNSRIHDNPNGILIRALLLQIPIVDIRVRRSPEMNSI
ncbi:MAG: hypothetical protein U0903_07425 [Planctomycetales bacterium]